MQVSYGYYDDCFSINAIDQAVWKAGQQAAPHPGIDLRAGDRESHGPSDCPVQFIEKLLPQPCGLFVVPSDRVVEFLLGQGKKTYLHER